MKKRRPWPALFFRLDILLSLYFWPPDSQLLCENVSLSSSKAGEVLRSDAVDLVVEAVLAMAESS
jgi:hypothetical protein